MECWAVVLGLSKTRLCGRLEGIKHVHKFKNKKEKRFLCTYHIFLHKTSLYLFENIPVYSFRILKTATAKLVLWFTYYI